MHVGDVLALAGGLPHGFGFKVKGLGFVCSLPGLKVVRRCGCYGVSVRMFGLYGVCKIGLGPLYGLTLRD